MKNSVACFLLCGALVVVAGVTVADENAPPVVVQGHKLFPASNNKYFAIPPEVYVGKSPGLETASYDPVVKRAVIGIEQKPVRTNGFIGKLEDWGAVASKSEIWLTASADKPVEKVAWQFSEDYYFRDAEIDSPAVKVIAWKPFLVNAKIKFADEPNFYTQAVWVKPGAQHATYTIDIGGENRDSVQPDKQGEGSMPE